MRTAIFVVVLMLAPVLLSGYLIDDREEHTVKVRGGRVLKREAWRDPVHFQTVNDWNRNEGRPDGQGNYVIGAIDAWLFLTANPGYEVRGLGACLRRFSEGNGKILGEQVFGMVRKRIVEDPEEWHRGMAAAVLSALMKVCDSVRLFRTGG